MIQLDRDQEPWWVWLVVLAIILMFVLWIKPY
jgi:hypothetical protein